MSHPAVASHSVSRPAWKFGASMRKPGSWWWSRRTSTPLFPRAGAFVLCAALLGCTASKPADERQDRGTLPTAGAVGVFGLRAAGETLAAVPSGFGLGMPAAGYHYVWQRCMDAACSSTIAVGTDAQTYPLVDADVDGFIRAGVYASNTCASGCGSSATVYSEANVVAGSAPTAGTVSLSGTWTVGSTLTAVPSGFAPGAPAGSLHYVWQRCSDAGCTSTTPVGTDGPTYTLAAADVDGRVRAGVHASNTCGSGCGSSATAYSTPTLVPGTAPTAGTVSISGIPWESLTAVPSDFTLGTPEASYHYVWQRCPDATCTSATPVGTDSPTYTPDAAGADGGRFIRAGMYASNDCVSRCGTTATIYSDATVVPGTFPVWGWVSVSGTWALGETLTADAVDFTLGTPAGSLHHLWQRCTELDCVEPLDVGAGPTYTLGNDDVNGFIRAGVYAENECASGCGTTTTAFSQPKLLLDVEWAHWHMPDSSFGCSSGTAPIPCPSSGEDGYGQDGNYLTAIDTFQTTAGTVLDWTTILYWQRAVPEATFTWTEATEYCAALTLDGEAAWRLPTYIELISIVDLGTSNPAVSAYAFSGTPAEAFWSSSPDAINAPYSAWAVDFGNGAAIIAPTGIANRVRCVR